MAVAVVAVTQAAVMAVIRAAVTLAVADLPMVVAEQCTAAERLAADTEYTANLIGC